MIMSVCIPNELIDSLTTFHSRLQHLLEHFQYLFLWMKIFWFPNLINWDGGNYPLGSDPIQFQFKDFLSTRPTGLTGGEGFILGFIDRGVVVSYRKRWRCRNGLGCRFHHRWVWESFFKHCSGTVDPHTLVLIKCYKGVEEMNGWFERVFSTFIIWDSVICCCHLVEKQGRESCHWTIMRLITAASFLAVVSANVNLYHRVFHPSLRDLPYAHRASISFPPDSNPIMIPSPQLYNSLVSFSEMLETLQNTDGALYQLALEHNGDTSNALWDLSSVKIVTLAILYSFVHTSYCVSVPSR